MTVKEKSGSEDDLSLFEILSTLLLNRKIIFLWTTVVTVSAIIFSLIMPESYRAEAVLLPSTTSNSFFEGITQSLGIEGVGDLLGSGGSDQTYRLKSILESRTMAEKTIEKFNLMERYNEELLDDAIKVFAGRMDVSINEDGTMGISATAKTKYFSFGTESKETSKLSAEITNYLVEQLDKINKELKLQKARNEKAFIQKRFDKTKRDLDSVATRLKEFSEQYGVISLPDQVKALVDISAQLDAQILIKEVELKSVKGYLNGEHPKILQLENEIEELKVKLKELKGDVAANELSTLLPGFKSVPSLAMQFFNLKRDVEVQSLLYKFLIQQLEQTKLQEARDTPTIQVLDYARAPQRRTSPWRTLIVLIAVFAGGLLGIGHALMHDRVLSLEKNEDADYLKFKKAMKAAKNDLFQLKG